MSQHSEQVEDGLTEEERAALAIKEEAEEQEQESEDEQQEHQAEDEQKDAGDTVADADADNANADDADASAATVQSDDKHQAESATAEKEQPRAPNAPILIATAPEGAAEKLADLERKMETLAAQLDDGEITGAQFNIELGKVNREHLELKLKVERAEMAQQMESQRIKNAWQEDCTKFLKDHPEYEDPDRLKLLDETIRALATMPSNQGIDNNKALAKAHRMVKMELGEEVEAPAAQKAPPAKPVQQKVPKPEAQPNIGNLPAAAMNDTSGGEFAALDRLAKSGRVEDYEAAVEALSESSRARYLRN